MSDVLILAWRYLIYHRLKAATVVASIAIIVYLPLGLNILIDHTAEQLRRRAAETPLLVGAKGSPLELVLRSLYFETDEPASIPYAQSQRVDESGLAEAIPLYTRFRSRQGPIVGSTLSYFEHRKLEIASGRPLARLGECVIGSQLASNSGLSVGDSLLSSSEDVFNLAGVYPLQMRIVGVLESNATADDDAAFVDLKTAWIMQGLGHGHQNLDSPEASAGVLRREGDRIVANASVIEYNEITPENAATFHFHGDISTFPITSVIAVPTDARASTLLQGRYLDPSEAVQIVRPLDVIVKLLSTVFAVSKYVTFAIMMVAASTLATMTLVFLLSLQLRRRELETIIKIGASRARIAAILGTEVVGVLLMGLTIAGLLAWATVELAPAAVDLLFQLT